MPQPVLIGNATLYFGDCLELLPHLQRSGCVDAIVSDPPYGIGFQCGAKPGNGLVAMTHPIQQGLKPVKGFEVLPRRWVVERTFAWLSRSRRLSKDYERKPTSSSGQVYIACSRLMLQHLCKR